MSKFRNRSLAAAFALTLLGSAGLASAQSTLHRYSVPGLSYESSSTQRNYEFRAPGVTHRMESTYPGGRADFDRRYEDTLRELRQGGGVQNNGSALRHGQSTTTFGGSVRGFGYERQFSSPSTTRSAQEEALHMWQRTEHLRSRGQTAR